MRIYNSLYKKVLDFKPLNPDLVTMYACGPTVYLDAQIGNFRTYALVDFVYRTLIFNGYNVKYIMNLTDVGHLTGDNTGDADTGKDRMEESAEKEGKGAREIADALINKFLADYDALNLSRPNKFTRATDYIQQQINLVKTLEEKGYAYKIADGMYFDTAKFESYGQLSGLRADSIKEGARVDINPEKRNPADFALWKFSPKDVKRTQEWNSPWGIGFPGWHLECSAMAMSELGETIDIHLGGEDLKMIHHQNEIAQSEAATDKKFVKYWVHGAFLTVDGGRMGKSLGNAYTLSDIQERGYNPLSLRYLYMTAHYRSLLNFTWEALQNAQNTLNKIYEIVEGLKEHSGALVSEKYMTKFQEALDNDLNMPRALAAVWELLRSEINESEKVATILRMDEVLGLDIASHVGFEIPERIMNLAKARKEYRKSGIWDKADMVRREIEEMGYMVEDLPNDAFEVHRKL